MLTSQFRSEQSAPLLSDGELGQLTSPNYLLLGQHEVSFNPCKAIRRGLSLLPNVITAEIVPGVGHAMVHGRPDWVMAPAFSFLERHAVAGDPQELDGSGRVLPEVTRPASR
jgi:hypothetical protein